MPERLPLAELVAEQRTRLSLSLAAIARGMAQAAMKEGSYCGASRQTVHEIERGRRIPHPDALRWLAVALNLPAEQVAKAAGRQRVNRRQLLRSAALVGGALGGGLLGERLAYALDGRGRLDAETVSDMAAITAGYRRAYRQLSVRVLRPQVRGHRAIVTELLGCSGTPMLRDRLVVTLGETEALLGCMLMLDLGNFDRASFHLGRALQAARHADARELEAFILGGMTFYAAYGGNQAEALRLVERGRQLASTGGTPATRGWLAAVDAEMQARAGNAISAQRALDEAAEAPRCPRSKPDDVGRHRHLQHGQARQLLRALLRPPWPAASCHRGVDAGAWRTGPGPAQASLHGHGRPGDGAHPAQGDR